MTRLGKEEIGRLLPHGPSMCLLESIEACDGQSISCRTATHRDPRNPLRFKGRLTAAAGLEYAAQAMGAHVGLTNGGRRPEDRIGLVGGVRDVAFATDRLDDREGWLVINATRLVEGEQGYMYHFTVSDGTSRLIEGRASIFVKAVPDGQ
jgi:predicted hotdog family 3-hydroxylacyl-ACP dehydratase